MPGYGDAQKKKVSSLPAEHIVRMSIPTYKRMSLLENLFCVLSMSVPMSVQMSMRMRISTVAAQLYIYKHV